MGVLTYQFGASGSSPNGNLLVSTHRQCRRAPSSNKYAIIYRNRSSWLALAHSVLLKETHSSVTILSSFLPQTYSHIFSEPLTTHRRSPTQLSALNKAHNQIKPTVDSLIIDNSHHFQSFNMSRTIGSGSSRLSTSSTKCDFTIYQREAAETKLYYLRDLLEPVEFDFAVDQELAFAWNNASDQDQQKAPQLKALVRKLASKVCINFWSSSHLR